MGQPRVQRFSFADPMAMQYEASRHLAAGFQIMNHSPALVTLVKRKRMTPGAVIATLVFGIFSAMIPFLVYLIIYATQSDEIIELHIVTAVAHEPVQAATSSSSDVAEPAGDDGQASPVADGPQVRMSLDGSMWWDGQDWQDVSLTAPSEAPRTDDGSHWWDGQQWHSMPTGSPA